MLNLVIKLHSISFQLGVKSALLLLDDLKLTVNNPYRFSEAINHYIKTSDLIKKIKSRFWVNNFFFETYLKNTWLHILIFYDSILPPT